MNVKQVIELTDRDIELLGTDLTEPSDNLILARKDLGYCGCPEEYALEAEAKEYKEAGIYDYMLTKQNLKMALKTGNLKEMTRAYLDFNNKVPKEVALNMKIDFNSIEHLFNDYKFACSMNGIMGIKTPPRAYLGQESEPSLSNVVDVMKGGN